MFTRARGGHEVWWAFGGLVVGGRHFWRAKVMGLMESFLPCWVVLVLGLVLLVAPLALPGRWSGAVNGFCLPSKC